MPTNRQKLYHEYFISVFGFCRRFHIQLAVYTTKQILFPDDPFEDDGTKLILYLITQIKAINVLFGKISPKALITITLIS